jgi:hypothetical protein
VVLIPRLLGLLELSRSSWHFIVASGSYGSRGYVLALALTASGSDICVCWDGRIEHPPLVE